MKTSHKMRLIAAAVAATFVGSAVGDALAQDRRDDYIRRWYQNNRQDDDYRRWQAGRFADSDYRRWYRRHHRNDNDATAAIFGLAVGGLVGGVLGNALANGGTTGSVAVQPGRVPPAGGHQAFSAGYMSYCSNKYRSFDPGSGTFIGNDGNRHYCR